MGVRSHQSAEERPHVAGASGPVLTSRSINQQAAVVPAGEACNAE